MSAGLTFLFAGIAAACSTATGTVSNHPTTTSSAGPFVSVNTTSWTVGGQVTIEVHNCDPNSNITVGLVQSPSGPQATYPFSEFVTESGKPVTGAWTRVATVPAIVIGPAKLGALCNSSLGQIKTPFVSVAVATPYRVHVTPMTVRRGQSFAIAATGPGCGEIDEPTAVLWSQGSMPTWGVAEAIGQTGAPSP